MLDVPGWPGHRAGQHVDVRLTAEDGYQAQRSYSIASAPEAPTSMLTVERIEDGEVSPYLADEVRAGDRFELRGPIGGYFVWTSALGGRCSWSAAAPAIVPLMAMLRHRAAANGRAPAALLYSSRSDDEIIYRGELEQLARQRTALKVVHTLTREQPARLGRAISRRIDRAMLEGVRLCRAGRPRIFVCGPTPLVEAAARRAARYRPRARLIKTERFGPTGT